MESKGLGFCMETFCLKWQRSEPDTTVMSSTVWEGLEREQRRNLLGVAGNWRDQGEGLCSFSGVPLSINSLLARSPLLLPDAPRSEEPSQRAWELEDKTCGGTQ